ncbi:MAG TPA: ribosome recycling factor [Candidatus Binataceae bacterium]|nr:ribosome recycling factor [Candidatus Binataceae bacterium]
MAAEEAHAEVIEMARLQMEEALESLRHEFARVRTGRASTALLEGLQVNYYGAKTPLRQLAGLSAPEPRLLVITPYDKGALHEIEKAIQTSDLGLTPINDGKIIRVPIPELTEERRKELVRHVRKVAEEHRVGVRNHRRDANDELKRLHKDKKLTDDALRAAEAKVQQLTTEVIDRIDKVLAAKEAEIMEV